MAADDVELVVPMTSEEKQAIEESAAKLGMNTSEYVRLRLKMYDYLQDHRDEIEALCDVIEDRGPAILANVDASRRIIKEMSDDLHNLKNHT